jgi:hypothetical protein
VGKKLLFLAIATLWLASCASVPEPFDDFNIIYFIDHVEPGFISPNNLRVQLGAKILTDWGQVKDAIESEEAVDALLIGPNMIGKIADQEALLLEYKRGLALVFFNTYADEVENLVDVYSFHVSWYAESADAKSMSGDFVIGVSRMTQCSNGKPAHPTLFQPCELSEDYGGGVSTSFSSSFAGELNTDWDVERFLWGFVGELQQMREAPQATLEP